MAQTFTWRVERSVTPTVEYRVVETQFGDGYKQTSADGINTKNEQYAITTHASASVAKLIRKFFDDHKGVRSFFWTPPLGELTLYTCKDPNFMQLAPDLYSITGTFVRTFSSSNGVNNG